MHSWENITGKNMRRWLLHAAERLHRVIVPTTSSWDRTGRKGSMVRLYKAIECIHNRFISLFGWDLRINFTQHVFPFLPIPLQYCSMVVPSHCLPVYGCTGLPSFCAICFWHGHDVIRVITNSKCHTSSLRKETVDIRMCLTGRLFHWRNDCIWCFLYRMNLLFCGQCVLTRLWFTQGCFPTTLEQATQSQIQVE